MYVISQTTVYIILFICLYSIVSDDVVDCTPNIIATTTDNYQCDEERYSLLLHSVL